MRSIAWNVPPSGSSPSASAQRPAGATSASAPSVVAWTPRSPRSIACSGRDVAQVAVNLNGREYVVTCGDGDEAHVRSLAGTVDARVAELVKALGQIGEARLLAMASILLADELHDLKSAPPAGAAQGNDAALDQFARRIESVAARLESA